MTTTNIITTRTDTPAASGYHIDGGRFEVRRNGGQLVARVNSPRYGSLACFHDYIRNGGARGRCYSMTDAAGTVVATMDGYTAAMTGTFVGC